MGGAVILMNTALDGRNTMAALEFAESCAEWLARQGEAGMHAKLLLAVDSESKAAGARQLLEAVLPAFQKRGIAAEAIVRRCAPEDLPGEIAALEPDLVFLSESKLSKKIKEELEVQKIEFPNPRKRELRMSLIYGAGAFLLYAGIFTSFETIKGVLMQKGAVSVVMVLGTVLAVAYLYGNTISHILRYLGLKPKAH